MLPHVDTDEGYVGQQRVLVLGGDDVQSGCGGVVAEPSPAAALDGESLSIDFL